MKKLNNEKGYALVIVLLIIVLFMGLAATFMAGSLNHAKQEKVVDTGNQAVAAAEMGTIYYSSDFERELKLLKEEMQQETQLKLNELIACIELPLGATCDSELERTAWEEKIDREMKELYVQKILEKSNELDALKLAGEENPFDGEQVKYHVKSATAKKMNAAQNDVEDLLVIDKEVKWVEIVLNVEGKAIDNQKELNAIFQVEIPDSFLDSTETRKINTIVITEDEDLTYDKVFSLTPPTISCADLVTAVKNKTAEAPYECKAKADETLKEFLASLDDDMDPKDFRVFTDDYADFVCENSCNNTDFQGINIVVNENDAGAPNNMNNLVNANLFISGKLSIGNNIINLGKNGEKQTIVVKELDVDVNLKNMYNTNFLVLGYQDKTRKAQIDWKNHIEVSNHSNFCIDIDRIDPDDLSRLEREIAFSDSGHLIYYTEVAEKNFVLRDKHGTINQELTSIYVTRASDYSTFLENCGISMKESKIVPIDVSVPEPIGSGFGLEVEY
ncbi:hypothetical protein AUC31_03095 [Planococcus rifietoensis]|uniref:Uncharacterized protein n=1 Tax=Planococcus rifietoensis TaxID=200991 RepID=A0A0U2ZED9_9BACL|nr:hypothetical protein [Planococcus rifietoensis]ALS74305.1 hypothetical protein AUC31_03095 [Planococcus rifietoensis]